MEQLGTLTPELQSLVSDPRIQRLAQARATRYIYSPFSDCLVPGYPGGFLPKGRIVGISTIVRENNHPSSTELPKDDPQRWEEIYPLEIVESVIGRYAPRGAVEIRALAGLPEANFNEMGLNNLFFGPATDEQGQARVLSVGQIRAGVDAALERMQNVAPVVKSRVQQIAQEILRAAQIAEADRRAHLDESHANIDKARNGNLNFNPAYDQCDMRSFKFLDREPETAAWRVKDAPQQAAQPPQAGVDWEAFGRGLASGLSEGIATKVVEQLKPASKARKQAEAQAA